MIDIVIQMATDKLPPWHSNQKEIEKLTDRVEEKETLDNETGLFDWQVNFFAFSGRDRHLEN